ncbi:flagellar biosynthesis protein FlhA [Tistrella bauzanensis]|uniref:Flagellar biosynthesis protein FlhA n=1 Tax=Tistrella bauzanensis TaxID=657419 RepID=A0ABQ1IHT6_9PROT|nr:flagellar biosynthesis protein FlhA [Tistrella bauzanensis]GGB39092.1 flagellar biosynthesis protein FlhA [Tistrella bauzanensis]
MAERGGLPTPISNPQGKGGGPGAPRGDGGVIGRFGTMLGSADLVVAFGMLFILVVMIFPIPTWTLDLLLSMSISLSLVILLITLFIQRPLDFSSFPTILLVSTMFRLALNIASTRLILSHGHEGTSAAGQVIEAFGQFVMGGNFMIGVIVFIILVLINFIVITKGSGRIAEVSARFSLDAMPGKQMAIDADLSAGLIDETTARRRRKDLEDESTFFGAMDGAAKFVRGDAIAGLLITVINVVGGIIIGTVQQGISFNEALRSYTLLTVGDGLVSQIPALLISTGAGLLVTKSGVIGTADQAIIGQLRKHPKAVGITAAMLVFMGMLPGIPTLPFWGFASVLGFMTWRLTRASRRAEAEAVAAAVEPPAVPMDEPISSALHIDLLRIELGYGLLPLISEERGHRLTEQIKALRRQIAGDLGFVMPAVRIQDNMQLPANTYVLRVKEIEAGRGELRPAMLLVMDPRGETISLPGEETTEPTFGLPAKWVEESRREEAHFRGLTVVDPATVLTTHLTEMVKEYMPELLSRIETQKLLDDLGPDHQKTVAEMIPSQITVGGLQRVLQNLLRERISVRDLPTILEGVSEACGYTQSAMLITEHVRARLARQICASVTSDQGYVPIITLSPDWEQAFAEALVGPGEEKQLAMAPTRLQEFISRVRQAFERQAMLGETPVLLTSPVIRPYVRSIIERFRPMTVVMSQNEIDSRARIRTVAQI